MRSLAILHALYLFSSACALRIGGGNPCASWPCLLDHLRRHTLVCVLAAGLAVHPLAPHAYAEVTSGVLRSQGAGIEVVRSGSIGSPVAGEVWALIDKYFLDRTFNGVDLKAEQIRLESLAPLTDEKALEESATLVRRLGDRYSRVLTPTQAIKLGKYDVTGVGLNLIISDSGKMLVGAVPNQGSAAERAGIEYGDEIVEINGKATKGMTSFDALEAIQVDPVVAVVAFKSKGDGVERTVSLKRAYTMVSDPVSWKIIAKDDGSKIGYLRISEFNSECKAKVADALRQMNDRQVSRIILDMRGNGGGVLDAAIGIAGLFSEKPLVLFVTDAGGAKQPLYSREPEVLARQPLQVWVNSRTASSAEVLAAALKDNCRARVVGTKTFGKGVIQGVFGLSDGGALIETVASYATPSGIEINARGVTPDEEHMFLTDILGASFLDGDIKAASITPPVCDDGGNGRARAATAGGGGVVVGGGGMPNKPDDTL